VVRSAIVSTLSTAQDGIRPNKLRKMVCKQIPGATWTQFAECLEKIMDDARSGFQMEDGNIVNSKAHHGTKKGNAQATTPSSTKEAKPSQESTTTSNTGGEVLQSKNVKVPRAIALHLTRKHFLKKKNIETNSKTKLTLHGIHGSASEGPLDELVTIQITRHRLVEIENDNEELAKKHIKTAQVLLEKMAQSYQKHPDRFAPKKAGGTLEEQEAKKQMTAARQTKVTKNQEKVPIKAQVTKSKRKKEKFY